MRGSTRGVHTPRDQLDEVAIDNELAAHEASNEVLAGSVKRVTFHNPGNGFCVLRIKARGRYTRLRSCSAAEPCEHHQRIGDYN